MELVTINNYAEKIYDITLKHPIRMIIYGPSGSGKSTFVEKLLFYMKDLFDIYFDNIIYCSGQAFPKINSVHGIPIIKITDINREIIDNINSNKNNLLILDDNMRKYAKDILISDIFTKFSHHKSISVIILLQNLFPKEQYMRDISTNANYIVLMRNKRELYPITRLSSQIGGAGSTYITNCFKESTKLNPFSYLLLDFDPETADEVKVRSNIFPNEITYAFDKIS